MSTVQHLDDQRACRHGSCVRLADGGWSACLTTWRHGVAVQVSWAGRTRILLAEPGTRGLPVGLPAQTRTAAARLLAAGMSTRESLGALKLLAIRQFGNRKPGPSLSLLDLHPSGMVEFAGRLAPPAVHIPDSGATRCYQFEEDERNEVQLAPGDYFAAFSRSFVKLVSAPLLGTLPTQVRGESNPCHVRDALTTCETNVMGMRADQFPPVAFVTLTRAS